MIPDVILLPPSIAIPIVFGFTPESSSVTFHSITGLLFVIVALAVGYIIVIIGGTFSLTISFKDAPSSVSVTSTVLMFPASSHAFNTTP
nr:MAG TPA: hypothetical protein [Caudoviricetes sp.]